MTRNAPQMPTPNAHAEVRSSTEPTAEHLERLLEKTSRTFALSIPQLPEPTRREVTVAYLLFRVADTLEDATLWPRPRKIAELARFAELLQNPTSDAAVELATAWVDDPPLAHDGYLELLADLPIVLRAHLGLSERARALVADHTCRTADRMSTFVAKEQDGLLQLHSLDELRSYCYGVAGIVGELLTELFVLDREALAPAADQLRADASRFGEALQLVNILKDAAFDTVEGRRYLPEGVEIGQLFALARGDLETAGRYSSRLFAQRAPRGIVAFALLPILLAWGTLDRVERDGAGAKLTRPEVREILDRMNEALDRGSLDGLCPTAPDAATGSPLRG